MQGIKNLSIGTRDGGREVIRFKAAIDGFDTQFTFDIRESSGEVGSSRGLEAYVMVVNGSE